MTAKTLVCSSSCEYLKTNDPYLVAADLLGDIVQSVNDSQPKLLALLILGDCNVFDVTHKAKVVYAVQTKKSASVSLVSLMCAASVRTYTPLSFS